MDTENCKYFVLSIFVLLVPIVNCRGRIERVDLLSALVFSLRGCSRFHARKSGKDNEYYTPWLVKIIYAGSPETDPHIYHHNEEGLRDTSAARDENGQSSSSSSNLRISNDPADQRQMT